MLQSAHVPSRSRIAVVGGGISGMGAAHMLAPHANVTLFESEKTLGGHARTKLAGKRGDQPVDTGFIVFNKVNYPHLVSLFEDLDVPVADSDMSFGASLRGGHLEYGLRDLRAIFAQPWRAGDPRFLRMLRDIMHFNVNALALSGAGMTIGDLLDVLGTGRWFRDYYLLPLSGAIWSTPRDRIMDFPAEAMMRFFENHALLSHTGQHQWYTVQGGSVQYVQRLDAAMRRAGVQVRCGAPIAGVRRKAGGGVSVRVRGGEWEAFDEVIFATHSDDTLRLLSDVTRDEAAALSAIRYQSNDVVLHADTAIMPRRKACWSSWVYTEEADRGAEGIDITYWMNSLQPIPKDDPLFVTLNSRRPIRDDLIHDQVTLRHPVYDLGAFEAQGKLARMNGQNGTWFCGAWMKNGFHEDGLSSAVDVVRAITDRAVPRAQVRVAAE